MESAPSETPDPSAELLARWQTEGDREALDQLLRIEISLLRGRIARSGRNLLSATTSASDVAQEAVAGMLRVNRPPSFDNPRALRAYLWTAAWRLLLQRLRKPSRNDAKVDLNTSQALGQALATTGGFSAVEQGERAAALNLTLNLLPPQDRKVLELVYFKRLSVGDAAAELDITAEAAAMRLTRARRNLALKLRDWADVVG